MAASQLFDSLNEIQHIQSLIDAVIRESEVLEYKRAASRFSNADKDETSKDVSAMANSLGGVIIYGVATDKHDKTKAQSIEGIEPTNIETLTGYSTQWFDRQFASQKNFSHLTIRV